MDTPSLTRRDALKVSLIGTAAVALPLQGTLSARDASELDAKKLPRPYAAPFTAPPVMQPTATDDVPGNSYGTIYSTGEDMVGSPYSGTDYYRLTHKPTQVGLLPGGVKTTMWGYEGLVPGPTIRTYRQNGMPRRVVMQHINNLPAKHPTLGYIPWTSTHLHGSPSKPQYDGYAGDLTQPGEWKTYHYPNNCPPRTLWYHDHGVHHTAENVYMGLAAQYHVVDEALEESLGIPRYRRDWAASGHPQYEYPLIISDVMFAKNGQLMWDDEGESGLYGDVILVNGVPWPKMTVEPRKYRFRILNGSLARGYTLKLSNGKPFQVIATDGGFMHKPQTVTQLTLGMAERIEVVIDFAGLQGATVNLLNGGVKNARDYDHTGKVMQFVVSRSAPTSLDGNSVPEILDPNPPVMGLTESMSTATRHMRLERSNGMWVINDETWDDVVRSNYERIFANPEPNAVEIWEVENSSGGWFHPLHIHLVDFQVLSRNGAPPRPEERGPKDVVYVGENETVRLLMKFEHEEGRYMIHCHNLSHEDHDMMTQFQVGHHDLDCDPINACPPGKGLPPELEPAQLPLPEVQDPLPGDTGTGSTGGTGDTATSTTTATPTTPAESTTGSTTTGSSTTTTAPSTSSAATPTPRAPRATTTARRRGR